MLSATLTFAFFFCGFLLLFTAGLTSVMLSVDWLESLLESDGVFLGLYVLSFVSLPESDFVLKLSV